MIACKFDASAIKLFFLLSLTVGQNKPD
jgi:hypothetical protein